MNYYQTKFLPIFSILFLTCVWLRPAQAAGFTPQGCQKVTECTLQELDDGATIQINDKILSNWSVGIVSGGDFNRSLDEFLITSVAPQMGFPGFRFQDPLMTNPGGVSIEFGFTVQVAPGSNAVITDIKAISVATGVDDEGAGTIVTIPNLKNDKAITLNNSGMDIKDFETPSRMQSPTIFVDYLASPGAISTLDIFFSQREADEKHSVTNPNRELLEFKIDPQAPDIAPSLQSQLSNALKELINDKKGTNYIFFDTNSNDNIEILSSLIEFPLLTDSSFLVSNGFTDLHLVYREEMGSNSGLDLGLLNQGSETFFSFDSSLFGSEFNAWQLTYAACNPNTNQCTEAGDDLKIPEPSSILSLFAIGTLGAALTFKRNGIK